MLNSPSRTTCRAAGQFIARSFGSAALKDDRPAAGERELRREEQLWNNTHTLTMAAGRQQNLATSKEENHTRFRQAELRGGTTYGRGLVAHADSKGMKLGVHWDDTVTAFPNGFRVLARHSREICIIIVNDDLTEAIVRKTLNLPRSKRVVLHICPTSRVPD